MLPDLTMGYRSLEHDQVNKSLYTFIAVLFIAGLTACGLAPAAPATPTRTPQSVAPTLPAPAAAPALVATAFDAHRAYEQNQMLSVTIGKRVAGTDNGAKAGDYIAQQFTSFGFQVEKQAFAFDMWEDRGTTVQVTAPQTSDVHATPLFYSPAGNVEAPLVAVSGTGTPNDFANVDVQGKIAIVSRGTIPFSEKAANAAKSGAAAVIVYNNQPATFSGTLGKNAAGTIPALAMSGTDGQSLLSMLSNGPVTVKIASDTAVVTHDAHNIIGTLPGSTDGVIVLGGHYDTVDAGPGAVDNGTGTAVLLELARVAAQQKHKNTLVFIAFDGEEYGLLGSEYYVKNLSSDAKAKIKGMFNFDMLGGGTGPLLAGGDGALGKLTRDTAAQMGITANNFRLGANSGSDHESFQKAGIDTVFFSRDYNLLHTPQDSIDQVNEQYLAEAGKVGEEALTRFDQQTTQ